MSRLIEVKLPKCTLFLTEQELLSLLARDRVLWETAIRRGKVILRARKQKQWTNGNRCQSREGGEDHAL